ncbi:MAG TPA: hypothetical protein VJT54_11270, partial [Verrucomicrobiae bacterium]|nr:hypothetical protein [Verrucomicrobiae bacterium]
KRQRAAAVQNLAGVSIRASETGHSFIDNALNHGWTRINTDSKGNNIRVHLCLSVVEMFKRLRF